MLRRGLPYVLVWMIAALAFCDPSPARLGQALAGCACALAARVWLASPRRYTICLAVSAAACVALAATVPPSAAALRAMVSAAGGIGAAYCLLRAIRG